MICIFLFEQNDSKQIIRKSMQIMPKNQSVIGISNMVLQKPQRNNSLPVFDILDIIDSTLQSFPV